MFAWDSRLNHIRSHSHECRDTCFKGRSGDTAGFRVCRYSYQHEFHVCDYGKKSADKICKTKNCPRARDVWKTSACGAKEMVHPNHCSAKGRVGTVKKRLRRGRVLRLPRRLVRCTDGVDRLEVAPSYYGDGTGEELNYIPQVNTETRYGNDGKVNVFRTNPMIGSSNPVLQSTLRCNVDVQCLDRVFALFSEVLAKIPEETPAMLGGDVKSSGCVVAKSAGPSRCGPETELVRLRARWGGYCSLENSIKPDGKSDELSVGGAQGGIPPLPVSRRSHFDDEENDHGFEHDDENDYCSVEFADEVGDESLSRGAQEACAFRIELLAAVEKMFKSAHDQSHYSTDYATKWHASVGELLPSIALGLDNLRAPPVVGSETDGNLVINDSYTKKKPAPAAKRWAALTSDEKVEEGRKTLIRIATMSNRTILKKLPEMMFQLKYGHECYRSHQTWTMFCKYPIRMLYEGQEVARLQRLGESGYDIHRHGKFRAQLGEEPAGCGDEDQAVAEENQFEPWVQVDQLTTETLRESGTSRDLKAAAVRKNRRELDVIGRQNLFDPSSAHEMHCNTSVGRSSKRVRRCDTSDLQSEHLEKLKAAAACKQKSVLDRVGKQKLLKGFHAYKQSCGTSEMDSSAHGSSDNLLPCSPFDLQSDLLEKGDAQDEQEPESLGGSVRPDVKLKGGGGDGHDVESGDVLGAPVCSQTVEAEGSLPETKPHGDGVRICLGQPVRQWDNYLLRSCREPLASMGLFHYSMYVYARKGCQLLEDFATYLYADPHPLARQEVQKLRVDECFRVPRVFGMTMSQEAVEPEQNAMVKIVLFMPLAFPTHLLELDDRARQDVIVRLLAGAADCKFAGVWNDWYAVQRVLADKFLARQKLAGRVFVIEDIFLGDEVEDQTDLQRESPTAAEFMAHITVRVATNLDMQAESKGRPRVPHVPDAKDFQLDEHYCAPKRSGAYATEETEGLPAGPREDVEVDDPIPRDPIQWLQESKYRVQDKDLHHYAFYKKRNTSAVMEKFCKAFSQGMCKSHMPKDAWFGASGRASLRCVMGNRPAEDCKAALLAQENLFNFKTTVSLPLAAEVDTESVVASPGVPGLVRDIGPVECVWADDTPRDYVAKLLLQRQHDPENPMTFDAAQLNFLAIVVTQLEKILAAEQGGEAVTQEVVLLMGQGGSGKTELVNIMQEVVWHFFGDDAYIAMAPSNTTARGVGGDTIHSSTGLWGDTKLTTDKLTKARTPAMMDRWRPVRVLVLDEVGMCGPDLFGAASFRICFLRGSVDKYTMKGFAFGGIKLVVLAGDFLQLNPMVTLGSRALVRLSLLEVPKRDHPPHLHEGHRCFNAVITSVLELKRTYRFRDEVSKEECKILPALFNYMRDPQGKSLPDYLWTALNECQVKLGTSTPDPRLSRARTRDGYEMAIAWEAVARLMQYRVVRDARTANEMLLYIQAIDVPSTELSSLEWDKLLSEVSLTKMGHRMTFLGIYQGMRVRLMAKLSVKHGLMQDAVGTVVDIQFHGNEFGIDAKDDWRHNPDHDAWSRGYVYLKKLPSAILVRFDNYTVDVGFGVGVVVLRPTKCTWKFLTHDVTEAGRKPREVTVIRYQFALAPEKIRTAQSGQGMSMGALTAMLDVNHGMDPEQWWFHVYVILSRARHIGHLLLYGLPPKSLFESGPPAWLRERLKEFDLRIRDTEQRAEGLLSNCDNFKVYERRSSTAADAGRGLSQTSGMADKVQHRNGKRDLEHIMPGPEASDTCTEVVFPCHSASGRAPTSLQCVDVAPAGIDGVLTTTAGDLERFSSKKCRSHASQPPLLSPAAIMLPLQNASEFLLTETGPHRPKRLRCQMGDLTDDNDCVVVEAGLASGVAASERLHQARDTVGPRRRRWRQGALREIDSRPEDLRDGFALPGRDESMPNSIDSQITLYNTQTARSRPEQGESHIFCLRRRLDLWEYVYGSPAITGGVKLYHVSTATSLAAIGNDGNSCFLIAVLQLFLRVEPVHLLLQKHYNECGCRNNSNCTVCALSLQSTALRRGKEMCKPCPVVHLARLGYFGNDFQRRRDDPLLGGPQCDACEFLEAMLRHLDGVTPHRVERFDKEYITDHGVRTVLQDAVFGFLTRVRSRCEHAACLSVSDSLHNSHLVLKLAFPVEHHTLESQGQKSSITLQEMWDYHFGEHLTATPCVSCRNSVVQQHFMEGEPPLLIMKLERGVKIEDGGMMVSRKIHSAVDFPETLDCMRTGKYALCGVVMHHGSQVSAGHYTVFCRMTEIGSTQVTTQGAYCFFRCLTSLSAERCTWDDLSKRETRQSVQLLLYARITEEKFASVVPASRTTPYARGKETVELLQNI